MKILYFHKVFSKDTFSPAFPRGGRLRERILYLCGNAPPAQKQALPAVRRASPADAVKSIKVYNKKEDDMEK